MCCHTFVENVLYNKNWEKTEKFLLRDFVDEFLLQVKSKIVTLICNIFTKNEMYFLESTDFCIWN